jgi:DNA invertase Pin-like site-specific DNA recombinase
MQRLESIKDQGQVSGASRPYGISSEFHRLSDEAISRTNQDRPGLARLQEFIARGHVGIAICTELSRLIRADNAL